MCLRVIRGSGREAATPLETERQSLYPISVATHPGESESGSKMGRRHINVHANRNVELCSKNINEAS